MKVLFCDFDGCLNHGGDPTSPKDKAGCLALNPYHVTFLNEIVEKTDCNIVLSTSWRHLYSILDNINFLVAAGFKYPEKVIGKTPEILGNRSLEIRGWLLTTTDKIDTYAILDDNSDAEIPGHFVKTDFYIGLGRWSTDRIIKILNEVSNEESSLLSKEDSQT